MTLWSEVMDVVKCALKKEKYPHTIHDEKAFYQLIYENGLIGLSFAAIDENRISKQFQKKLTQGFYDYVSRDTKQEVAIQEIRQLLNMNGIDFLYLKGTRMKALYPETYMRGMGDIDLLVHEEDMMNVRNLFEGKEIICTHPSKQHDFYEMKNGLNIEVHPRLFKDFNPRYKTLMDDVWNHLHHVDQHEYEMIPEYEIIYLTYHLAKHMDASGIGIRSVLDLGVYLSKKETLMDESLLRTFLEQAKMTRFYQSMIDLTSSLFDFHFMLPIHQEKLLNDNDKELLIQYLVTSGIHGLGNAFNPFAAREANYRLKKKSKWNMIKDLMFPDMDSMKIMYPYVKKCKILLPFAWISRWIKLMFKKTKSSVQKVKQLHTDVSKVKELEEIFIKIGLND